MQTFRRKMADAIEAALVRIRSRKTTTNTSLRELWDKQGSAPVTVENVCMEAGKSRSALYRHHPELIDRINLAAGRGAKESRLTPLSKRLAEANAFADAKEAENLSLRTKIAYLEIKLHDLEKRMKHAARKVQRATGETLVDFSGAQPSGPSPTSSPPAAVD